MKHKYNEFIGVNELIGIGMVINSLSIFSKIIGNIHDNQELLK